MEGMGPVKSSNLISGAKSHGEYRKMRTEIITHSFGMGFFMLKGGNINGKMAFYIGISN